MPAQDSRHSKENRIFLPISLKLNLKKQLISMIEELRAEAVNYLALKKCFSNKENNLFRNIQAV